MAHVFITGSSDGLGLLAGRMLAQQGHDVVLHARNAERAGAARAALRASKAVVIGDVSSMTNVHAIAEQANALGRFDAVIHNVGIGDRETRRVATVDGLSHVFAVNVVAPYLLTALIDRPDRLVYLSSGMHRGGDAGLDDPQWEKRRWNGSQAYSDSKLHDLILAMALARHWPDVLVNAVDPGWVPTRMGGPNAPDDLSEGASTQTWLAVGADPEARVSGRYLHHRKPGHMNPVAQRQDVQDRLLGYLRGLTGVAIARRT
jgi:NAD(P)-dependent dehydrogenase (short-subunit alcohol dehydrogenase family)